MVFVAAVVLVAAALGACSSGSGRKTTPTTRKAAPPTPTTRKSGSTATTRPAGGSLTQAIFGLALTTPPPVTVPPGGCPVARTQTFVVTVTDAGLATRCITLRSSQSLDVANTGQLFHNVTIADLSANLDVGDVQPYGRIGHYLSPGTYGISSASDPRPAFYGTLVVTP